jgi:hypothetical protein
VALVGFISFHCSIDFSLDSPGMHLIASMPIFKTHIISSECHGMCRHDRPGQTQIYELTQNSSLDISPSSSIKREPDSGGLFPQDSTLPHIVQNAQCSKLNQQWPACHRCDNNHTPFPKLGTVPITPYTAKKTKFEDVLSSIWKTHILRGAEFVDIGIYNTFNKKWSIPPSLARSRGFLFF